ncbi:MAG: ATP synthase F0 subunit B [Chthonomonadales bacterium]|nr:ATP synthase F0 subunit B [Chthonomonadales bacterium]
MGQILLDSLRIDPLVLLLNGALFLVLLVTMDRVFWKPILRHLDQRRAGISAAYQAVDDARHEMEALRADYQRRLAGIEAEARGRIQQTVRAAQTERERVLAEARGQAEQAARDGAAAIAQERDRAVAGMREALDDVALTILAKATGAVPGANARRLVDEYIASNVLKS